MPLLFSLADPMTVGLLLLAPTESLLKEMPLSFLCQAEINTFLEIESRQDF